MTFDGWRWYEDEGLDGLADRRRAGRRSPAHVRLWLVVSTAWRMSWVAASGCDAKET